MAVYQTSHATASWVQAPDKVKIHNQLLEMLKSHESIRTLLPGHHELVSKLHEVDILISYEIASTLWQARDTNNLESRSVINTPSSLLTATSFESEFPSKNNSDSSSSPLLSPKTRDFRKEKSYPEIAAQHPKPPQVTILGNAEGIRLERARLSKKRKAPQPASKLPSSVTKKRRI